MSKYAHALRRNITYRQRKACSEKADQQKGSVQLHDVLEKVEIRNLFQTNTMKILIQTAEKKMLSLAL